MAWGGRRGGWGLGRLGEAVSSTLQLHHPAAAAGVVRDGFGVIEEA